MRLRHIEVFYEVYTNKSITAAAYALNISQPSVSKALMHAESQIGFALFKRNAGRLTPTDEANVLFREIAPLFERLEDIRALTQNLRAGAGGHIRLALVPALALDIAPNAIASFRSTHPQVNFSLQVLHFDEVNKALLTREADFAVMFDPVANPLLQSFRIGTGEIVALARVGDFNADAGKLAIADLIDHPYIGSKDTGPLSEILNRSLDGAGAKLNEVVSVDAYYAAVEVVRSGGGIALLDEFTARARLAEGLAVHRLVPDLSFGVHCVHMQDRPLSRVAQAFLGLMKDRVQAVHAAAG